RQRAFQLQQRHVGLVYAEMGYPEASRREVAQVPAASIRMPNEILCLLSRALWHLDRGEAAQAARLLPESEDLLRRGIACGALADPWNILGFQAMYPLASSPENS